MPPVLCIGNVISVTTSFQRIVNPIFHEEPQNSEREPLPPGNSQHLSDIAIRHTNGRQPHHGKENGDHDGIKSINVLLAESVPEVTREIGEVNANGGVGECEEDHEVEQPAAGGRAAEVWERHGQECGHLFRNTFGWMRCGIARLAAAIIRRTGSSAGAGMIITFHQGNAEVIGGSGE